MILTRYVVHPTLLPTENFWLLLHLLALHVVFSSCSALPPLSLKFWKITLQTRETSPDCILCSPGSNISLLLGFILFIRHTLFLPSLYFCQFFLLCLMTAGHRYESPKIYLDRVYRLLLLIRCSTYFVCFFSPVLCNSLWCCASPVGRWTTRCGVEFRFGIGRLGR